jgi:hypothetical protein
MLLVMQESLSLESGGNRHMINLTVEFDKNKYAELIKKCSRLASEKEIDKAISKGAKKAADEAKK